MSTPSQVRAELKKRNLSYTIYKIKSCWYVDGPNCELWDSTSLCTYKFDGASAAFWVDIIQEMEVEHKSREIDWRTAVAAMSAADSALGILNPTRPVILTGKDAIEYVKETFWLRMDEPVPGLNIAGNEVDGNGVNNATIGNAIDACDEDPTLVSYELTRNRANAEFVGMAESAAACYGHSVKAALDNGTAGVLVHGELIQANNSTPCGMAAARLYAAWDVEQIDWSEIVPKIFWKWENEIKDMAKNCYYDLMRNHGAVKPAEPNEIRKLRNEALGL